jgi:hypothetical protein
VDAPLTECQIVELKKTGEEKPEDKPEEKDETEKG